MANYLDFSSDKIDIFLLLIDKSSSMEDDEENVQKGLKMYKKSFENFPEKNSIAVSISYFSDGFYPKEFKKIEELDTIYRTDGSTALFYSISKAGEYLKEYIDEVVEKTKITPRATFVLFSDGEPCQDYGNRSEAEETIEKMNYAGITTVFVAFGDAIRSEFGKEMGFMSTIDVNNRDTLVEFLGVELSKSCKEQSKSLKPLGSNFFSQGFDQSSSNGYSATTSQVLEDDSWIDDI